MNDCPHLYWTTETRTVGDTQYIYFSCNACDHHITKTVQVRQPWHQNGPEKAADTEKTSGPEANPPNRKP